MCGKEPYPPDYKARKYRLDKHSLSKVVVLLFYSFGSLLNFFQHDFKHIMKNLPVPVDDKDIEEMFDFADKDKDGKLSYEEFLIRNIGLFGWSVIKIVLNAFSPSFSLS